VREDAVREPRDEAGLADPAGAQHADLVLLRHRVHSSGTFERSTWNVALLACDASLGRTPPARAPSPPGSTPRAASAATVRSARSRESASFPSGGPLASVYPTTV